MLGYVIGSYLQLVMVFGPAILLLFTSRVRGWVKARWVFYSLLPWLLGQMLLLVWVLLASRESQVEFLMFGSGGVYIATWIAAWIIYFVFRSRFRKPSTPSEAPAPLPQDPTPT
ncbi:MAG TPA: hypothetical protein PLZ79_10220 [Burkholderiales bacterium]|nr:hypothetical protein [Betaproteobacteria bacterium]HQR53634.1 hypothetical protein [Burkholderiales bacterium]